MCLITGTYMTHQEHRIVTQGRYIPHILASTQDAMEWKRKHMQQSLTFKTDFEKSYDKANWFFISWMLTYLGCVHQCYGEKFLWIRVPQQTE